MLAGHRVTAMVAVVGVLLGACGGGDSDPSPSPAPTTDPAVTAPPSLTPEEQAAAEIQATFEELIASWDDFKANASDYGGEPGWNSELVGQWNVRGEGSSELANWIGAWRSSEIEQVGRTTVASHSVTEVQLNLTDQGVSEATSVACLDMSQLEYVGFDESSADLPAEPPAHQTWSMNWTYSPQEDPAAGVDEVGWYLLGLELSMEVPC